MFKSVEARFALRALLVGVAAFVGSLQAGASILQSALAGASGALAYAGVGAVAPAVEPSIGRKLGP